VSNGEQDPPQSGDAGQPADVEEGAGPFGEPPTPEELDALDQSMTTDRRPLGPDTDGGTQVAEGEGPPSDVPPTSPA